jgi:hypothetical protein
LSIGFDHQLEHFVGGGFELGKKIFESDLGASFLAQRFGFLFAWPASSRAAFSSSTTLNSRPASGTPFKPRTFHRDRRAGFLKTFAFLTNERPDAAEY